MELGPLAIKALETVRGLSPTASNLTQASREYGAEAARWAFEQWDLRKRAQSKFARAEQMLFDRDGLEMASHEAMARFHAAQFPPDE
ncbi:MAG TPA: hypothetical protein PLX06_15380, partial [Fimbriimonadaceae bacterium]|nr:hypothetical protein [Fimbriimonadaceae bacterium]